MLNLGSSTNNTHLGDVLITGNLEVNNDLIVHGTITADISNPMIEADIIKTLTPGGALFIQNSSGAGIGAFTNNLDLVIDNDILTTNGKIGASSNYIEPTGFGLNVVGTNNVIISTTFGGSSISMVIDGQIALECFDGFNRMQIPLQVETINGGSAPLDNLDLNSTTSGTKGFIICNDKTKILDTLTIENPDPQFILSNPTGPNEAIELRNLISGSILKINNSALLASIGNTIGDAKITFDHITDELKFRSEAKDILTMGFPDSVWTTNVHLNKAVPNITLIDTAGPLTTAFTNNQTFSKWENPQAPGGAVNITMFHNGIIRMTTDGLTQVDISNTEIDFALPLVMDGNTIYGNATPSGNLLLESTTNATKGDVKVLDRLVCNQSIRAYNTAYSTSVGLPVNVGFYSQVASASVTNTLTELSLVNQTGAGSGTTIPANFLKVGDQFHISAMCQASTDGGDSTATLRYYMNGVVRQTTGAVKWNFNAGSVLKIDIYFTVRTIGATGTIQINTTTSFSESGKQDLNGNYLTPALITINTTSSITQNLTFQWDSAEPLDSVICQQLNIRKVY